MDFPLSGAIQKIEAWSTVLQHVGKIKDWLWHNKGKLEIPQPLIFRGQSDCRWTLETTLERRGRMGQIKCADYFALAESIREEVERESKKSFNIPAKRIAEKLRSRKHMQTALLGQDDGLVGLMNYWIHLRHHGFPSPLLDWTLSLDAAAYFAFHGASDRGIETVSIYAYCEMPKGVKGHWGADPAIWNVSHAISPLRRHREQEAQYTLCCVPFSEQCSFTLHQETLNLAPRCQDCLVKFELPSQLGSDLLKKSEVEKIGRSLDWVSLDKRIEKLVDRVFGTKGTAYPYRIR